MNKVWKQIRKYQKEIVLVLFLFSLASLLLPLFSTGFDYWWHLKTGEYIVSTGVIPTQDIYSWYGMVQGLPWISHEWLSEVILVGFQNLFGASHVFFYIGFFLLTTLVTLYFCLRKEMNRNLLVTLLYFVLGTIFLGATLTPRPHMISTLFFLISVFLVFDLYHHENSKKIYVLPLISLLWANVHGGSSNLPYLLCFLFCGFSLVTSCLRKMKSAKLSIKQWKKFLTIGVLCLLATTFNPHGLQMVWYPYSNMMDGFMKGIITEWRNPSIFLLGDLPFFLYSVLIFLFVCLRKKKPDLIPTLILICFFGLSLTSIRFIPYFYLLSAFVLFPLVEEKKYQGIVTWILGGASIFLLFQGVMAFPSTVNRLQEPLLEEEVISYLKEVKPKRLYNYYDYGGYLLYKDIPVFVDGRADVYSKHNLKDFITLLDAQENVAFLLSYYDFDYLLIPSSCSLATYLERQENYEKVLISEQIVLYKKL